MADSRRNRGNSAASAKSAGNKSTVRASQKTTARAGQKSTVRSPGKASSRGRSTTVRKSTTRRAAVSGGTVRSGSYRSGGGSGWYIVSGIVLGCLLLYLLHGDKIVSLFSSKLERRGKSYSSVVVFESDESVPEIDPAVLARWRDNIRRKTHQSSGAISKTDEKVLTLLSEAHAFLEAGAQKEGQERNRLYDMVIRICRHIGELDGVSEVYRREALNLKVSALHHKTL